MDLRTFYGSLEQDYEVVLKRMMGKENFLYSMLCKFKAYQTMEELEKAVQSHEADKIFNQAHNLKGVAENLGLKPIYESVSQLVELTRKGSVEGAEEAFARVKQSYDRVMELMETVTPEG